MIGAVFAGLTLVIVVAQEIRWLRAQKRVDWSWYRGKSSDFLGTPLAFENNNGIPVESVMVMTVNCSLDAGETKKMWPVLRDGDRQNLMLRGVSEESWVSLNWRHPRRKRYESTWFPVLEEGPVWEAFEQQSVKAHLSRWSPRASSGHAGPDGGLRGRIPASARKLLREIDRATSR